MKDRRGRKLEECAENIELHDAQVKDFSDKIDAVREAIREIDKEINASGASVANLRDNIRARKLAKEIGETQAEIDSYDMEEAAKARRNFEEKYGKAKEKENSLHTSVSCQLSLREQCNSTPCAVFSSCGRSQLSGVSAQELGV